MKKSHLIILKKLAESKNYGQGSGARAAVSNWLLKIYDELVRLKLLTTVRKTVDLEAAAVRTISDIRKSLIMKTGLIFWQRKSELTADEPFQTRPFDFADIRSLLMSEII